MARWLGSLPPLTIFQSLAASDSLSVRKEFDHGIAISKIRLRFNQGCQDLLKYKITINHQNFFDFMQTAGQEVYGDNETIDWDGYIEFPIGTNVIEITVTNSDTFAHTLKFILNIEKIQ